MNDRIVQQVGTPMKLYEKPANLFVATSAAPPTFFRPRDA
jgi:ABC-type sugar transport system ATPase subunit